MAARLIALALLLTGCAGADGPTGEGATELSALSGRWTLDQLGGAPTHGEIWMEIRDGQIAGSAGCNRFTGSIEQGDDGETRIGPVAATKRYCPDQALMDQEQQLLTLISKTRSLDVREGRLSMQVDAGRSLEWQADSE